MAIPTYEGLMLPVLQRLGTGQDVRIAELVGDLAKALNLSQDDLNVMLPSGQSTTFGSRVAWAKTYLKQAGLVEQPKRGVVRIAKRGQDVLASGVARVDNQTLSQFAEFVAFRNRSKSSVSEHDAVAPIALNAATPLASVQAPHERLEDAAKELAATLADDILSSIQACSPAFFEELVVQLLLKMGYGGSRKEAGQAVGRTGDGGIDGVIAEDRLGLDSIYVQAKRWQGTVGEPDVRNFLGALVGRGASKGVFITTSSFSEPARAFVARSLQQRIVLIDGDRLAELMIEHDLGVSTVATYQVKRLDSDFFSDE
ncbi:MAG: restriction endonuclease [Leptothrix sp. (in: b-proteobacteria)]